MFSIDFIALSVRDLDRSREFLGNVFGATTKESHGGRLATVELGSLNLVLCTSETLAEEFGVDLSLRERLTTRALLSVPFSSKSEVEDCAERFLRSGASPIKAPGPTSWGGFSALCEDLDQHLWELVWNPRRAKVS